MIRHVVNLANYLCAKVCFPGPSVSLSKNHNSGDRVSDKLSWNDLFLTYDSDFEEVLLDNCDSGEIAKNHETVVIDQIKGGWVKTRLLKKNCPGCSRPQKPGILTENVYSDSKIRLS